MDTSTLLGLLLAAGGAVAFFQGNKAKGPTPEVQPTATPEAGVSREQAMKALDVLYGYYGKSQDAAEALQMLAKQLFAVKVE